MTAKIYRLPTTPAQPDGSKSRRLSEASPGSKEAVEWMARQPKLFRDHLREMTTKAPAPFAAIQHDLDHAQIIDAHGRPVSDDLFHRAHGHYVVTFMNMHAAAVEKETT